MSAELQPCSKSVEGTVVCNKALVHPWFAIIIIVAKQNINASTVTHALWFGVGEVLEFAYKTMWSMDLFHFFKLVLYFMS